MIQLEVIQPHQTKLNIELDHIIIPGVDGDFGVSEGHTPFLTQIRPGILTCYDEHDSKTNYAIHDGFVMVDKNLVKIVCENIEKADEIDHKRANDAQERAEKRLFAEKKVQNVNFRRAEYALKRALARIDTAKL